MTMPKIFDDLDVSAVEWFKEIEWNPMRRPIGEFIYSDLKQCFYIFIKKNISENKFVDAIIHELGHYDLTKVLLSIKISAILGRHLYPEWIHPEPSTTLKKMEQSIDRCMKNRDV